MLPRIDFLKTGLWLLGLWMAALALFQLAPGIDLTVSSWFWMPGQGFVFQNSPLWQNIRYALWNLQIALCLFALAMLVVTWLSKRDWYGLSARAMAFVCTLFLLGPGLLVNGFFKSFGGRARPANVTEFGGEHLFSRPWVFAGQCQGNCSFPSGETSSMVAMAVSVWLIVALIPVPAWVRTIIRGIMVASVVFISVQRVTDGRHFLSDVTFAVLMVLTLAWGLYALFSGAVSWRRQR